MYSDLIDSAAASLSGQTGWKFDRSAEYLENIIFNNEIDIPGFLASVLDGSFSLFPPVRIRRGKKKAARRDLWKAPYRVQEARITGLTESECEELNEIRRDYFCRYCTSEERTAALAALDAFFRAMDIEQGRHYCRLNEFGIWDTSRKDLLYGFITRPVKREKYWKQSLREELQAEGLHVLRIH